MPLAIAIVCILTSTSLSQYQFNQSNHLNRNSELKSVLLGPIYFFLVSFYRAKLRVARYCQGKLSVRLSVTLRYRDHIGWNSAKIISRLTSLTLSLSADPNVTDPKGTPRILAGIGMG